VFSQQVEHALHIAQTAHAGQTRKGSAKPYIVHPLHVALILARAGADDMTLQAGILHDVVEDCDGWTLDRIQGEFGQEVCTVVAELTEDKSLPWIERKQAAIDHVPGMTQAAVLVKAADKLHNLSSLLADLRDADDPDDVWSHFSAGPSETLAMSRGLVEALGRRVERGLGRTLLGTLEALEQECDGV
jgi:(p)ppGpp synthase/HD superfamily hydrolase